MPLHSGKKRRRKVAAAPGISSTRRSEDVPVGRPCGWLPASLASLFGFFVSLCLLLTYRLGLRTRSLRAGAEAFDASSWQLPAERRPSADDLGSSARPPGAAAGAEAASSPARAGGEPAAAALGGAAPPGAAALRGAAAARPAPPATAAGLPRPPPALAAAPAVAAAAPPTPPERPAAEAPRAAAGRPSRGCTLDHGYANSQITGGRDTGGVKRPEDCQKMCLAAEDCSCYSWKQDGFCRLGAAASCSYVGSTDDQNWRFGRCGAGFAQGPGPPAASTAAEPADWPEVYRRHFGQAVSRNVHVFYYMWYGNMAFDRRWVHWNHELLPHWDRRINQNWPPGRHEPDVGDIASPFWPRLGPYSSRDPAVVRAHVQQMRQAAIGVAVVSWYPSGLQDGNGQFGSEEVLPLLLTEAAKVGIEVAIHIEPYPGRTPATVRKDIEFIIQNYGRHTALCRRVASGAHSKLLTEPQKSLALPVIYVYDSYHNPAAEWGSVLREGPLSIRNTALDAIVFCLWVEQQHEAYLSEGGFDGAYTYFAADRASYGSTSSNWPAMAAAAERHGALFLPSVGPGYNDLKVRPWNKKATRPRDNGQYYSRMVQAAVDVAPAILSLTSWNEWHEGTSLEPAVPNAGPPAYQDYGAEGPEAYLERTKEAAGKLARKQAQVPVLFVTHVRAQYLRRALAAALLHRPHPEVFPLIASQDGTDRGVAEVVEDHMRRGDVAKHLTFHAPASMKTGYQRLCAHYRWALDQLFVDMGFQQAIILEEDIEVSPDFFSYFATSLPLLRADPQLFCVSAWNDNGRPEVASDSLAVYRTDFFPGLGWMLLRALWLEVRGGWPVSYWDEYMRRSDVRKGRHCLRPEVSRTHTFGEQGVSKGQFYKTHLVQNRLNTEKVEWSADAFNSVSTAGHFEKHLSNLVRSAELVSFEWLKGQRLSWGPQRSFAILYREADWKVLAGFFGLMDDAKEGVRRGTYRGVLPFSWQSCRVYLVRDWPLQ